MTTHNPYGRGFEAARRSAAIAVCPFCQEFLTTGGESCEPVRNERGWWHNYMKDGGVARCAASAIWDMEAQTDPEAE